MSEFFRKLFTSDFMPHAFCFLYNPGIVWLHAISDTVIALSYFVIPIALVYFVRRRADLPFHWIFLMFGLFIFGCGMTHVMEVWTLWHGTYRLAGVVKAITALASVATAVALVQLLPQAVALPSPAQLRAANRELEREVAERRRAEAALEAARDELETKVRERTAELLLMQTELAHVVRVTTMGELAASIAHEVNQPLTAIIANANAGLRWLSTNPPNLAEAHETFDRILHSAQHASDVVGRIRTLLKKSQPEPREQDVNDLVRDVLSIVDNTLIKHGIEVRLELSDAVPSVLGDRVQLQQVILNLLMNGVEAMDAVTDRKRRLVLASSVLESTQVAVTVRDAGIGVEPAAFSKLFNPFFTTKPAGMGMGLSVSRTIVKNHGGDLWATPNDGPGVTFHVTLPAMA
jgi:C4-dicarboxylate-specific signal transduction histidine kinase